MDEPRADVLTARTVMIVQASLGIFVISIILSLEAFSLKEKFHKLTAHKRTDRAIIYLMGMSLFSIAVYIISMSMYSNDWRGNPGGCQLAGQPFLPLCFVIAKQFMYYFLYERASIVLDTLKMNDRIFTLLRRIIVLAILVGIPCRVFQPEGICVFYFISMGPVVAFASVDVVLSLTLLFLFAYPLYDRIRQLRRDVVEQIDKSMFKLLRWNMILSTVITMSTACNLIIMVILMAFHHKEVDRDLEHWQIYAMFFPAGDVTVSCIASHAMTSAWMPKRLADKFRSKKTEEEAAARVATAPDHFALPARTSKNGSTQNNKESCKVVIPISFASSQNNLTVA